MICLHVHVTFLFNFGKGLSYHITINALLLFCCTYYTRTFIYFCLIDLFIWQNNFRHQQAAFCYHQAEASLRSASSSPYACALPITSPSLSRCVWVLFALVLIPSGFIYLCYEYPAFWVAVLMFLYVWNMYFTLFFAF